MNLNCFTFFLSMFFSLASTGQVFTDVSQVQGVYHSYVGGLYGGGVSFYDADGDGWDDITLCSNSNGIKFFRNVNGNFDDGTILIQSNDEFKSAHWVDYDNDGDADLFVTRYLSNWSLYKNNGSIYNLVDVTAEANLPTATVYETMGHSWGDIDSDGDLDLYICNYNSIGGTNLMFLNNGDGTFTDYTQESGTADGNKSSFQSLFIDYNNNGEIDLFVINDRDPYSNSLYKNNNGEFDDVTIPTGMEIYICSMNTSVADYDHDGDFDMYISNSLGGNYLLKYTSNPGYFENVAVEAGVAVFQRSWSALWIDFDNDGWEDLHVCKNPFGGFTGQNKLFLNNHDGTFTEVTNSNYLPSGPAVASYSSAQADFNHDGYLDIVVLNQAPHNVELLLNEGGQNNYISIDLVGVESNKDAIGSRISVWANGEEHIRFTHCGEGYLTQNSGTKTIGVGDAPVIDSLIINWPSGLTETVHNLLINQKYEFIEGEITNELIDDLSQLIYFDTLLCGIDSLPIIASNPSDVIWNTGTESGTLWVTEPGDYWYEFNFEGETLNSDTLTVYGNETFTPTITSSSPALCYEDEVGSIEFELLPSDELVSYSINGIEEGSLEALQAGSYDLILINELGCTYFETLTITSPPPLEAVFEVSQALCFEDNSTVDVVISGGTPSYSTFWQGFNPNNAEPGTYSPYVQDVNGCSVQAAITIESVEELIVNLNSEPSLNGDDGTITLIVNGGTGEYTFQWSGPNGFTSSSQNVEGLAPGFYTLVVEDTNECIVSGSILVSDVSVNDLNEFEGVIYPQPADEFIFIESIHSIDQISIFGLHGQQVQVSFSTLSDSKMKLDVSTLKPGLYVLQIYSGYTTNRSIMVVQ